jgi:caa(3)-type oxidase subunit IV
MADSPEELQKHMKDNTLVGAALLAFTVITVVVSWFDFGSTFLNVGIGLAIATFKAGLVALIFMHLNHERPMIYRILVFTCFFAAGGMVLFILALKDPISL